MRRILLTALLVGVTAIWGWTFVVVKDATAAYGVVGFLAIRFAIAAAALGPICLRRATRRTLWAGAGIGVAMAAGYLLQTAGLQYTTPTNSGLITGLFVVFAPISAWAFFRVRMDWTLLVSVAISLIGLMFLTGQMPGELRVGDFLTLGCAAAFGVHIALLSRYACEHDALVLALGQVLAAAVLFGAAWPCVEPLALPSGQVWLSLLLTGVVASALAFYIQTLVQQRLSAASTAIILTMEPVFVALFGYWLAGDRLTAVQVAGATCILAAQVWATAWGLRRRDEACRSVTHPGGRGRQVPQAGPGAAVEGPEGPGERN
ncbi:MAG: DMT family transporter [Planctomycetota bacterium]|nr:DMT family transporter [Planctomycetota bacterium]